MKKNLLFAAIALTALAGCSDNSFVGDESPQGSLTGDGSISFNMNTAAVTRAGGSTAATALDQQFIVWGEKNESGGTAVTVPSTNIVFPNYQVNWVDLANSTTSNSSGWEYVGYTHSNTASTDDYQTNITPHLSVAQEIKYWDMSATNYVFTAVSALKSDIKTGKIQISKTLSGTDQYKKGYTITAAAGADFDHLYFADRNIITTGYGTSAVTMNFRNILSHIRVGIYETIPGYAVSAIKFYSTDFEAANEFKTSGETPTSIFGATVDNLKPGANTLTVTYNDGSVNSSLQNRPVVSTSGARATTITLGQNFNTLSTSSVMATSSATPTWETADGAYTKVFPREDVTTDLTLKVKYTLYNANSGETMDITGTAVVPGEYLQWKPNYKYSYIFKLTDDALTPITFDAVQVETETGSIEYITTVDNSSITTYQNGTEVTTKNEYITGKPIYVVVADGTALTVGTNAKLYTATESSFVEGITENTVANALANGVEGYAEVTPANGTSLIGYYTRSGVDPSYTYTACVSGTADGSTKYYLPTRTLTDAGSHTLVVTNAPGLEAFTSIAKEDSPTGETLTINGAKFTPSAVGNYVFEYKDGSNNKHYKVIKVVSGS
ncbi:MAG: hypothetical protein J5954_10240 [Prevotella sp.]|nr:hypothetical protein [Prevotella sp.]MBO6192248.1 hypothetical protein [Prevotella sp.]